MSSRNGDELDDLFRQALRPHTQARPPEHLWRRILRRTRATNSTRATGSGRWWSEWVSWLVALHASLELTVPLVAPQPYRYNTFLYSPLVPSSFASIMLSQIRDRSLALW